MDNSYEDIQPLKRILQSQLEALMFLENVEHPMREHVLKSFLDGAEIEPGPLTIRVPVLEQERLVVHRNQDELDRRARLHALYHSYEKVCTAIQDGQYSRDSRFQMLRQATASLDQSARDIWRQRRRVVVSGRRWSEIPLSIRQWIALNESALLLWAAAYSVRFWLEQFGRKLASFALDRVSVTTYCL